MKNLVALGTILLFTFPAFADIPPAPGTKLTQTLTGEVAQILADSLVEGVITLPVQERFTNQCNVLINKGIVHTAKTSTSSVRVVCTEYYCMGHIANCTLTEQY